jgi:hypothetical protein
MRITKVKYDGKKVRVEYERGSLTDPDEFLVSCKDEPSVEFKDALQALQPDVNELCEFPIDQALSIRSVSYSHTNGIMGACVTALRSLKKANSPLVINTPHLPSEPYSDNADELTLDPNMTERLIHLANLAEMYVGGDARAQASLLDAPAEQPAELSLTLSI